MSQAAPHEFSLTTKNTASLTMGIAAVVVGVLALLFGWVPFLGLFAVPVAALGVALAGLGLLFAMMRRFKGVGLPLLGGVLSVAGVGVPLLSTGGATVAISETAEQVSVEMDNARERIAEERAQREQERAQAEQATRARHASYIANQLDLYDVEAKYMYAVLDGEVPGVLFKLKNKGKETLSRVKVTVYFQDESGGIIAEEEFHPVNVNSYSSRNKEPLKPGYNWQMEKGRFYSAKSVPSEWSEGSIDAKVTEVDFAESQ
ncbi:MAG: hypothetical protein AAF368_16445 [Planctomycetota bacterium]